MEGSFKNSFADKLPGRSYTFSSHLEAGEYFSLPPEKSVPYWYSPIIDEDTGLCIGYIDKGTTGLYDIYDYNGYFVNRMELPLEHPFLDPLDIIFLGYVVYKGFRFGLNAFEAITKRGLSVRFPSMIGEHFVSILRGRMKVGLSPITLKFTTSPANHMKNPGRYVPVLILEKAIRFGKRLPDSLRKSALSTVRYEIKIRRSRYNDAAKIFENKDYTLEVIVDERTWTITHFAYKS